MKTQKKGKGKLVSIRVDEELWEKAKIYAVKNRMTLQKLITNCLRRELDGG